MKGIEAGKQHLSRDTAAYGGLQTYQKKRPDPVIPDGEKSELGFGTRKPPVRAKDPYKRSKELLAGLLGKK